MKKASSAALSMARVSVLLVLSATLLIFLLFQRIGLALLPLVRNKILPSKLLVLPSWVLKLASAYPWICRFLNLLIYF